MYEFFLIIYKIGPGALFSVPIPQRMSFNVKQKLAMSPAVIFFAVGITIDTFLYMYICFRPSYVVPSTVAHGIKLVHPMFRGYTQQVNERCQYWIVTGCIEYKRSLLTSSTVALFSHGHMKHKSIDSYYLFCSSHCKQRIPF